MLQQQIISLKTSPSTSESNNEQLGQYRKRMCLRIGSVPVAEDETSEGVFNRVFNVLDMCKKGSINISENDIDRAHRIDKPYVRNISKKHCKSIIVRFTSFLKLTLVYHEKKRY